VLQPVGSFEWAIRRVNGFYGIPEPKSSGTRVPKRRYEVSGSFERQVMAARVFARVIVLCVAISAGGVEAIEILPVCGGALSQGLLAPEARSDLNACVASARQSVGDSAERVISVSLYVDYKGRAKSPTILRPSGLAAFDDSVLRCLAEARFTPLGTGSTFRYWLFRSDPRAAATAPSSGAQLTASPTSASAQAPDDPTKALPFTTVCVCVDEKGSTIGTPQIIRSSGKRRIDNGALRMATAGRYLPGTEDGKAVPGCVSFNVRFMNMR
jgi:hypothetical protein